MKDSLYKGGNASEQAGSAGSGAHAKQEEEKKEEEKKEEEKKVEDEVVGLMAELSVKEREPGTFLYEDLV